MANEKETKKWTMVIAGNNVREYECPNVGEETDAIVRYFTGRILGEFVLSQAIEKIKENNKKIEEFKNKLLMGE
jgi:hypothetical protein